MDIGNAYSPALTVLTCNRCRLQDLEAPKQQMCQKIRLHEFQNLYNPLTEENDDPVHISRMLEVFLAESCAKK
jgi:hypothetical protein